ncbi:DUF4145 domain-containing protein [Pseudoalteromonas sp. BZP1]|uniref:DUF4145 domain-containing protein n=1 Tax=unclassified Pseudoalteromonas TaxID=194690 RepID=UPI002594667E|nr:DUF4145 domain-containing protein [uncultured Pseudoalteromonas sp.]
MKGKYIPPFLDGDAFNCANCHVYTKQQWYFMRGSTQSNGYGGQREDDRFKVSYCDHCNFPTIWHKDTLLFPSNISVEGPSEDLPNDVKLDYEEARTIVNLSPRGAAALLRLGIQKLCAHLGQPGKNINADIKALVAEGLPPKVQEALDSVRVIGNDAVHPGTIDLNDNRDIANQLFRLVNFIAQKMITEPKEIEDIYNSLPAEKLKGINERDGSK